MIRFHLDKTVKLSVYEQIKGQLLSAIYCGKIKEGDRLPSMRELSGELQVNYKTVRKVYVKLAQEKYLEIVKGSGAFLQERSGEDYYEQMRRRAVFRLLKEVSAKARALRVAPEKFSSLLQNYVTGTNLRTLRLVVVDDEEEAYIFSRELRMRLGAEVSAVPLDCLTDSFATEALRRSHYLLTTSWHLEEVAKLTQDYGKELIEIKASHQVYREILDTARHRNVAIVIRDEKTLHASWEVFMNIYRPSTQKKFWIAPIHREDLVETIIRDADLIFVSPMCWDEMRKRTPADKELKTYENFISRETVENLRQRQLLG